MTPTTTRLSIAGAVALATSIASMGHAAASDSCGDLGLGKNKNAIHDALRTALSAVAPNAALNGGLNNNMWATLVDRDGIVCAIAFTGDTRNDQWPGSRVISAQKADTAASFNLPAHKGGTVDALSTANLYTAVQPGGSLYGLQFSNPVNPAAAYNGDPGKFGTSNDPLVGVHPGGVNVFGGGLGLYNASGDKVGAVGVSGDTSCADHNVAWRLRGQLGLDKLTTAGVKGLSAAGHEDNIIYDLSDTDKHDAVDHSASGFGHPKCGFGEDAIALPATT